MLIITALCAAAGFTHVVLFVVSLHLAYLVVAIAYVALAAVGFAFAPGARR